MKAVPGFSSCVRLRDALVFTFGEDTLVDNLSPEENAFGWRLASKPRLLFSVSTSDGKLPVDRFDLKVSVVDDSLENGEILFGPESAILKIQQVCDVVFRCTQAQSRNRKMHPTAIGLCEKEGARRGG